MSRLSVTMTPGNQVFAKEQWIAARDGVVGIRHVSGLLSQAGDGVHDSLPLPSAISMSRKDKLPPTKVLSGALNGCRCASGTMSPENALLRKECRLPQSHR